MTTAFDAASLLDQFGDETLVRELAQLLLDTAPVQVARILGAVECGDAPTVKSAAHQLRGALGTFGATAPTQDAYTLEAMGAAGDLQGAAPVAANLDRHVRSLCDGARDWLSSAQAGDEAHRAA